MSGIYKEYYSEYIESLTNEIDTIFENLMNELNNDRKRNYSNTISLDKNLLDKHCDDLIHKLKQLKSEKPVKL